MRPNPLPLLALCLLAATAVEARQTPNPEGRGLLDPDGRVVSPGRPWAKAPGAALAADPVLVPLPAGAVQIDSTWYDLQDMGSLGRRVAIDSEGRVHVTWQDDLCDAAGLCPPNVNLPQPFPQRGMVYAYREPGGAWVNRGKVADPRVRNCCVTELFGGFGSLALTPDGRAAISQHLNEDGCDLRGNFYLQETPGGTPWRGQLTPFSGGDSFLFPQVAALPDGRFIVLGEVPIGGSYAETQDFRVSVFADGDRAYTCFQYQGGPWTSVVPLNLFKGNQPAFPSIAVAPSGKVGIAVGDFIGNVFLVESSNGSFSAGTITIRNLTNYSDAQITAADSTSTAYRPYVHTSIAYRDTTPHVVWSELQARREGGQIFTYDYRSRIMHWNSQTGTQVVYQVVPGQADRFDDVDQGLSGPLGGFNTLSVDWPQVGLSPDGSEVYVLFSWMSDAMVDPTADMQLPGIVTGVGFGEIVACVSRQGGPFSAPQNLTNTPTTDERFFSIPAINPGGRAHILFQASQTNQAGVVQIADRGTVAQLVLRRIAYMEPVLQGSLVGVEDGAMPAAAAALRLWPNPARGAVSFRLAQAAGAAAIQVYAVDGRLVARVPVGADGGARWDGTTARGKAAPGGLYFARPEGPAAPAVKFMLLH